MSVKLVRLQAGLLLFGASLALMVVARLGLSPWDVLHQGIARQLHIEIGWVVIGVGALVLAVWIPLRQRPGAGTVCNVILVGLAVNASLAVLPVPAGLPLRWLYLVSGVLLNAVATGLYIGAGLGPGPRDGLMTGIAARGYSLRLVRTGLELSVLAGGFALGGTVGIGTVVYAISIGPLVHALLPRLTFASRSPGDAGKPDVQIGSVSPTLAIGTPAWRPGNRPGGGGGAGECAGECAAEKGATR